MVETINELAVLTGLNPVVILILGLFGLLWCCSLLGGNK
tara:strand:+ start:322 stop:438 length:117 start_codon:yes stop_codon:yes gene_type:complete